MALPPTDSPAPDFRLQDQHGHDVTLAQFRGRHVVLYFYPKDNTPGCTQEACDFRDEHSALQAAGAVVLGVSPDDLKSHQKFATKFSLPFSLLADPAHAVCEAYGVWGEKSLYGRTFLGVTRATFLIGPQGEVVRVWPKVKVAGHVGEILQVLRGEEAEAPAAKPKAASKSPARKSPARKTPSRN
ncbi:thioredoxin-dependent thiol peroxidase [Melittangium boletus]|uniref:thioredoxin-dependent thiol peroxidase n=1 Tax=Melittangium boletus TaxID=83453 RepID=UPI003DA22441